MITKLVIVSLILGSLCYCSNAEPIPYHNDNNSNNNNEVLQQQQQQQQQQIQQQSSSPLPPNVKQSSSSISSASTSTQQQQQIFLNDLKFDIGENLPNGTLVGIIKSPQSHPPFLIVPTHPTRDEEIRSAFNINQATGEIRTAVILDHELKEQYSFLAIASNGNEIKCTVLVRDLNDNRPTFLPSNRTSFALPEGSKGARRSLPVAIDQDSNQFGIKEYRIVAGNKGDIFRLVENRTKDMLYVDLEVANGQLDRENVPSYQLTIEAVDGGSPPLVGQLIVDITVQDLNDNKPVFTQDRYEGEVKENAIIGSQILQVEAHDPDADQNGQITYHILKRTGHSAQQPFTSTTASTVSKSTTTTTTTTITTTAAAAASTSDIIASLENGSSANNHHHGNSDTYDNNIQIETNNFNNNNNNNNNKQSNTKAPSNTVDAPYFSLNSNTGKIYLARELDFETEPIHELVIEARDAGVQSLKTYTIVTIHVIDVNDNPPTINILFLTENRKPYISESVKSGEVIARVTIEDADSPNAINPQKSLDNNKQQSFQVSMSGGDNKFELTSQDPTTYLLTVGGQFDRSTKSVYHLVITVRDGFDYTYGSSSSTSTAAAMTRSNNGYYDDTFSNNNGNQYTEVSRSNGTTTRAIDIHISDSAITSNTLSAGESIFAKQLGQMTGTTSSESLVSSFINQLASQSSGTIFGGLVVILFICMLTFLYKAKNKPESNYIEAGLALSTNSGQLKGDSDGSYGSHHHVNGLMSNHGFSHQGSGRHIHQQHFSTTNPYQTMYGHNSSYLNSSQVGPHPYQSINDSPLMLMATSCNPLMNNSQQAIGHQLMNQVSACPHQCHSISIGNIGNIQSQQQENCASEEELQMLSEKNSNRPSSSTTNSRMMTPPIPAEYARQLQLLGINRNATPTLDKWTYIPGVPTQLVNTTDLTGSYNWDYLSDWTPAFSSALSSIVS